MAPLIPRGILLRVDKYRERDTVTQMYVAVAGPRDCFSPPFQIPDSVNPQFLIIIDLEFPILSSSFSRSFLHCPLCCVRSLWIIHISHGKGSCFFFFFHHFVIYTFSYLSIGKFICMGYIIKVWLPISSSLRKFLFLI